MRDLLPFYEKELNYLRRYGREFAERYPRIAGRLQLSPEGSQDPHVERLIEAFALLTARVSKRIEDDYPELVDSLLEVLYPHYLRPFPSCSIACFLTPELLDARAAVRIPRGTSLRSRPVRGVECEFRTTYDVTILPLRISAACYRPVAVAPLATALPSGTAGQISISVELASEKTSFDALDADVLRLFLDGEPSLRAGLKDALMLDVLAAYVEADDDGRWRQLPRAPLAPVGFAREEMLLDLPSRSHPGYGLLTELFAFPEKFGFVDLLLPSLVQGACRRFTLHLVLRHGGAGRSGRGVLEALAPDNLRLGCSPVVNLFSTPGEPIRISHRAVHYPVLADSRRAFAYEVHSVDSVYRIQQTSQGRTTQAFRPFYSLHHGEDVDRTARYWMLRRDDDVARLSPGYETEICFVDLAFDPAQPQTDTASLQLTCSNRDLPHQLAFGVPGGDLVMEGSGPVKAIQLLRKPSRSRQAARGRGAQWRLISHLSLNALSLSGGGLSALKELLALYDADQTSVSARQIEGLVGMEQRPMVTWLPGREFGSFVRGLDVRLTLDEASFVGSGVSTFAHVMDRFFAMYVHTNSFTRLTLMSSATGEEIVQCAPRSGESILG